jgi:hypothetical protein
MRRKSRMQRQQQQSKPIVNLSRVRIEEQSRHAKAYAVARRRLPCVYIVHCRSRPFPKAMHLSILLNVVLRTGELHSSPPNAPVIIPTETAHPKYISGKSYATQ